MNTKERPVVLLFHLFQQGDDDATVSSPEVLERVCRFVADLQVPTFISLRQLSS